MHTPPQPENVCCLEATKANVLFYMPPPSPGEAWPMVCNEGKSSIPFKKKSILAVHIRIAQGKLKEEKQL